jgi:hypothetical protein
MKGDFSKWEFDPNDNFNGVLHQQGRVFLDSDGSDQTRILNHWQETAGQDIIGSGIAAVPAQVPNAFKVTQAQAILEGTPAVPVGATVTLLPGHLWADGLLVHLATQPKATTVLRRADYLGSPAPLSPDGSNDRDAVILEVWREAVNGFQIPEKLLEPALGGPDTTERVYTAMALRLLRLAADETCENIGDRLRDDFATKGKLTVTLRPTTVIPSDCPVVEGGGYTGFEHNLYRVEIAQVSAAQPVQFKWSQFNGGLVGRGDCALGGADKKITITANNLAIQSANLETFYLEVVELDPDRGYWRVTYGAEVTLNGDLLEVSTERYTEPSLPTGNVFFRLWNGIRPISAFPVATPPTDLLDGIRLAFEADAPGKYTAGDYWTFKLRAGEIANPETLLDKAPPEGIHYHRVPLAELHWNIGGQLSFDAPLIEDCRKVFPPLTNQRVCCSILVGDGIRSQGDFNSIEEALDHLPPQGGKICLLPGVHLTNAVIQRRQNIRITGCGVHTIVHPRPNQPSDPIFRITASQGIQLDDMTLMTNTGTAIQVLDDFKTSPPISIRAVGAIEAASRAISVLNNRIVALTHAVEVRVTDQAGNNDIWIAANKIAMLDKPEGDVAIFSDADGVLIERNQIVVIPAPDPNRPNDPRQPGDPSTGVFDPCATPTAAYVAGFPIRQFIYSTFQYVSFAVSSVVFPRILYQTRSGIQIVGGSEFVTICRNQIIGGRGNGITFGDLPVIEGEGVLLLARSLTYATVPDEALKRLQERFNSTLYSITIEENTIQSMGLAGIGVEAFFSLNRVGLLIRVEDLTIYRNSITHCAQQIPAELPETMLGEIGFGGIVLTDCENVIIQENRIESNGINHLDPICGILILMGEKVEVSRNRILDNGPRTSLTNDNVRRGLRGGVVVAMSFKALNSKLISDTELLSPDGIPAVKVHDNIITQPLGQALLLLALGPISVVGNQLTSQGADFRVNPLSLLAGTIYILNLGISQDLLVFLLLASFRNLAAANNAVFEANYRPDVANTIRRLLYLPSGTVLFANNQVTLDLRTDEINRAFSSLLIASLDDVAFNSNQSNCNSFIDVILFDTVLFAVSVRSNDNRFQEGISMTFYSLFSYGLMNTATGNQATHCLHVLGSLVAEADNRVLFPFNCKEDNLQLKQRFGGTATTISG